MSKQLFRAIQDGSTSKVRKALRDHSSAIGSQDESGRTGLHLAAEEGQLNIVRLLLSKRADINATDINGWTPLHVAANTAKFDVCEELLKAKNVDATLQNKDNSTPFIYLVRLGKNMIKGNYKQYRRVLKMMLELDIDINAKTATGETALQLACFRGTLTSIHFLLDNGADVNVLNDKNETALHWAVRANKLEMVDALMQHGADPFLASSGETPMEMAIANGKMKNLVTLMEAKALVCEEAKKECNKASYLYRYHQGKWKSIFAVLKGTIIFLYNSDNGSAKPIATFDILETEVKEAVSEKEKKGALYAFRITEPEKATTLFKTDKQIECLDWVESINQGRRIFQRTEGSFAPTEQRTKVADTEEIQNALIRLLDHSGNQVCADCASSGSFWMLLKYGALVCFDCAEVHESLNTSEIKSVYFDSWSLDDTMILKCNGNTKHNNKMEANVMLGATRPTLSDPISVKETFIKQKYISNAFQGKSDDKLSPRTLELKQALAVRISNYGENYSITRLLKRLSISKILWEHLQKSPIYDKIKAAIEQGQDSKFDDFLITLLLAKLKFVMGFLPKLLNDCLTVVRLMEANTKSTRPIKSSLRRLLEIYEQQQEILYDKHLEIIFKWWLPQIVEVLATVQSNHDRYDLSVLIDLFRQHSAVALFLLTGDYLVADGTFSNPQDLIIDDKLLKERSEKIKQYCKEHTKALRTLIQNSATKTSQVKASVSRIDSYPSVHRSLSRTKSSEPFPMLYRGESSMNSLSHTSTNDYANSPRHGSDAFLQYDEYDETENPLVRMYSQSPNSLSSMLCSVVSELSQTIQQNILGTVCSGHNLTATGDPACENIFAPPDCSVDEYTNSAQIILESLRNKWPISVDTEYCAILQRQLYLIKSQIDAIYSLPVPWNLPEVWNNWNSLQKILHDGLEFLYHCAVLSKPRPFVASTFCLLIVQLRWSFTKLCEVQQVDLCSN